MTTATITADAATTGATTVDPPPGRSGEREPVTAGRVLAGLLAAAGMQLGAVVTAFGALAIWLIANTESLFVERAEPLWWGAFAMPVLVLAWVLWVASGAVAARIMRSRAGWFVLFLLPWVIIGAPAFGVLL